MQSSFFYKYFDDIDIGERIHSRGRTVTEADVVHWCCHTGDMFLLHTNADYAARSRFGKRISPGIMVYAFSAGLIIPPDAQVIIANYGADKIRYIQPTFIGDTIHGCVSVAEKEIRSESDGVLILQWDVHNQDGNLLIASRMNILWARSNESGAE